MKLKNILGLAALVGAGYKAYQNRAAISKKITDSKAAIQEGQDSLTAITSQVADLKDQTKAIQKTTDDLTYRVRVFQQESQPHLQAITAIWDKYKNKDNPR